MQQVQTGRFKLEKSEIYRQGNGGSNAPQAGRPNEVRKFGSKSLQNESGGAGQTQKVKVLKNHVNIKKETIKLVKSLTSSIIILGQNCRLSVLPRF